MAILTFEQPLNELTRVNLRLEYLFKKISGNIGNSDYWAIRATIESISQIMHIIDRPDLKSKYAKAIQQEINYLQELANQPNIDPTKLGQMMDELQRLFQAHNQTGQKLGATLRQNHCLNTIRQHMLCPGGEADFEIPAYQHWLSSNTQAIQTRLTDLFDQLTEVKDTVTTLLMLTRNKAKQQRLTATKGLHQETLDTNGNTQLVRINVDDQLNTYPIVSAGKHRINIRFYEASHLQSEEQRQDDIDFQLFCCG